MTNDKKMELYGSWFNHFLTVARFAEYYELDEKEAEKIIEEGREMWNARAKVIQFAEAAKALKISGKPPKVIVIHHESEVSA